MIFLAWAAPATAAKLAPSDDPLPGSLFQAANGEQEPTEAQFDDWAPFESAGRVVHAPDPNDEDTAFKGGSKEDEPGEWDLTTEEGGVDPAKDNIRDAWAAVDQPGGRTFAYLAYAREKEEGTTFVTFELNRDSRLWNNGRARIPCRRTGDVLISFAPLGNRDALVVVSRWETTATDPATSCATKGTLTLATGLDDGVDVQGAPNDRSIANVLPGAYGATIPAGRFGETGIDLAKVLDDAFGDDCLAYASVWMHSRSSDSESSNMQDYVAPRPLDARTCAAAGTKFFDRNANRQRDDGEPGLPRFEIFADYDGDGVLDRRRAVHRHRRRRALRARRHPAAGRHIRRCASSSSIPARAPGAARTPTRSPEGPFGCGHGPIDAAAEPYARGRDFGNWFPARLTVRKELFPPDDPGRFDLLVNDTLALPAAGDGAVRTEQVNPGSYSFSEVAVPPTDATAYTSTTECKRSPRRRRQAPGTSFGPLQLLAGDHVICTFHNVRNDLPERVPAITIDKVGPVTAPAGATLHYDLYVENIGEVPFPASAVQVTDPRCDAAPKLRGKSGPGGGEDPTPGTLDPGDIWRYGCSRTTLGPPVNCIVHLETNTATVTVPVADGSLEDSSTIGTTVTCPEPPLEPGTPTPPPGGSTLDEVLAPLGPTPPEAGVSGAAALSPLRSCLRRGSIVTIRGEHIDRVAVSVAGRARPRAGRAAAAPSGADRAAAQLPARALPGARGDPVRARRRDRPARPDAAGHGLRAAAVHRLTAGPWPATR